MYAELKNERTYLILTMQRNPALEKVERLLGDRRVPIHEEYTENPTDITDEVFKNEPEWGDMDDWRMPYWNVNRLGMSCTVIGDKTIFIGGEHEDYYDPNFYVYNDVIVVTDETVRVYGYSYHVFPPTDFHCAIAIDDHIWILGNVGYYSREREVIQVCRLHVPTMKMELLDASGDAPPWINFHESQGHSCTLQEDGVSILLVTCNKEAWVLDTRNCIWTKQHQ